MRSVERVSDLEEAKQPGYSDPHAQRSTRHARAITAVTVSRGTIAKCSFPSSSKEIKSELFRGEKLIKPRCGTSKTRPEAVSIRNGLFFASKSSTRETSTRKGYLRGKIASMFPDGRMFFSRCFRLNPIPEWRAGKTRKRSATSATTSTTRSKQKPEPNPRPKQARG